MSDDRLDEELLQALEARARRGLKRETTLDGSVPGVDFGSNDYLGLSRDPAIAEAMVAALSFGVGGRSARLLAGGSPLHEQSEAAVAEWLCAEAALLFPSGYQANLGLVGSMVGRGDAVISDRDNHASLIDGARLSRARILVHEHCDLADLERALRAASGARRRLVLTEGVFSMGGDLAPLAEIDALCRRYDAWLVVDEAHAAGLLGVDGSGAWSAAGVEGEHRLCARVVTGGKSLGVSCAFVAGSEAMRRHLVHAARSFLFTTAPPPPVAGALLAAVRRCREAAPLRAAALANARRLASLLALPAPAAAIVPFPVGDSAAAAALARSLRGEGFYAPAVRPPTVPEASAGLRLVCRADQTSAQIERLAALLRDHVSATAPAAPLLRRAQVTCIAGTDTGVGKTVVSALLMRAALRLGPSRYWKPLQTGDDDDTATVRSLSGAAQEAMLANHAWFPLPASPHEAAAAAGSRVDVGALRAALEQHRSARADRLLVEFAGGLHVPIDMDPVVLQLDWLATMEADVVLVARSGLGTLNHTLLSVESRRARGLRPRALFLVGPRHESNARTLRSLAGVDLCYEVPTFDELGPAALDSWLDRHDLTDLLHV
ncbi:MAG: dethiobiotin synthase [Planctomycetota bacterium]|nr:dethiobiotin synthase [Planctomycetota bacterium]